jgi:biopolymer transport protein ExbB/TolQ
MFRIFEKYLEQLGERRGMLLLASILIWVSILLAIYAYGIGMGGIAVWRITGDAYRAISEIVTDRAYGGDPWAIFMGAVVWVLLIILIFPLRAARKVRRDYRRQEMQSQKALTEIEARIFAADDRSSNVHSPQERLARRALSNIETELLGEPQPADLTVEERLIELRNS